MNPRLRAVLAGIATFVPGLYRPEAGRTGGTVSARYCYSVWLRHLSMARRSGLMRHPEVVAELGPGDSLGIGLAALISGSSRYCALDVVRYVDVSRNVAIFDELVELFRTREPIPGPSELPEVKPSLDVYDFPRHALPDPHLERALEGRRLEAIRRVLLGEVGAGGPERLGLDYVVPWLDDRVIRRDSVDLMFSQAVLEHIDDLRGAYRALYRWLRRDGMMSHQIDFRSHQLATRWNGHWSYSDFEWRLIRGTRPYLLNRHPCSVHLELLVQSGFHVVGTLRTTRSDGVGREHLATRFRNLSDEDLRTSDAFIQAVKAT